MEQDGRLSVLLSPLGKKYFRAYDTMQACIITSEFLANGFFCKLLYVKQGGNFKTGVSVSPKMQLEHKVYSLYLYFYGLIGIKKISL